jgi:uncharacterized protein YlxW (UPF0749 family)
VLLDALSIFASGLGGVILTMVVGAIRERRAERRTAAKLQAQHLQDELEAIKSSQNSLQQQVCRLQGALEALERTVNGKAGR